MSEIPAAQSMARRNLAQRIECLLSRLVWEGRQPTATEAYNIVLSIVCLEGGDCPQGEEHMQMAARRLEADSVNLTGLSDLERLCEQLTKVAAELD